MRNYESEHANQTLERNWNKKGMKLVLFKKVESWNCITHYMLLGGMASVQVRWRPFCLCPCLFRA